MEKKYSEAEAARERKEQKGFANVLASTGLSQLKPIRVTRTADSSQAKAAKPKPKKKG
jgi:hypothetical protein